MKLLSIDVGIKNLAYCLFYISDNTTINIIDWKIINLCEEKKTCNCIIDNKKRNKELDNDYKLNTTCNKSAKYFINNKYFCLVHAKKSSYIIPSINTDIINYKKLNNIELKEICRKYNIINKNNNENNNENKSSLQKMIKNFLIENLLQNVSNISSNDMSLIEIGISIVNKLDFDLDLYADIIIIENQISPIANKMKCIQGMIAQYFIMRDMKNIIFVSAINKLKKFTNKKLSYSERKKLSIQVTDSILTNYNLTNWNNFFNLSKTHKKKDDLADCFLQGIWYMEKEKYIINLQ